MRQIIRNLALLAYCQRLVKESFKYTLLKISMAIAYKYNLLPEPDRSQDPVQLLEPPVTMEDLAWALGAARPAVDATDLEKMEQFTKEHVE